MNKKQSRLDKVEKVLGQALQVLEAQGNALNYLLTEVNNLKVENIEVVEEDPSQLKMDFPKQEEDELIR